METYNKTREYKEILQEENLTEKQVEFIFEEMSKVNWKVKAFKQEGKKAKNLNPSLLKSLLEQYNKRDDVNLFTGEIIGSGKDNPFIERGIPINFIADTSGSMY